MRAQVASRAGLVPVCTRRSDGACCGVQGLMQLQRLLVHRHNFAQYSTQSHSSTSRKLLQPPEWQEPLPTGWPVTGADTLRQPVDAGDGAAAGVLRERIVDDARVVHFGSADDLVVGSRRVGGGGGIPQPAVPADSAVGDGATPDVPLGDDPAATGCVGDCVGGEHDVIEEGDELYDVEREGAASGVPEREEEEVQKAGELANKALAEDGFGFKIDYSYVEDAMGVRVAGKASHAGEDSSVGAALGADIPDEDADGYADILADDDAGDVAGDVAGDDAGDESGDDAGDDAGVPEEQEAEPEGDAEEKGGSQGAAEASKAVRRSAGDVYKTRRTGVKTKTVWPIKSMGRRAGMGAAGGENGDADIVAAKRAGDDGDYEVHGWTDPEPDPMEESDEVEEEEEDNDDDDGGLEADAVVAGVVDMGDYTGVEDAVADARTDAEYEAKVSSVRMQYRQRAQLQQRAARQRSLRHRTG